MPICTRSRSKKDPKDDDTKKLPSRATRPAPPPEPSSTEEEEEEKVPVAELLKRPSRATRLPSVKQEKVEKNEKKAAILETMKLPSRPTRKTIDLDEEEEDDDSPFVKKRSTRVNVKRTDSTASSRSTRAAAGAAALSPGFTAPSTSRGKGQGGMKLPKVLDKPVEKKKPPPKGKGKVDKVFAGRQPHLFEESSEEDEIMPPPPPPRRTRDKRKAKPAAAGNSKASVTVLSSSSSSTSDIFVPVEKKAKQTKKPAFLLQAPTPVKEEEESSAAESASQEEATTSARGRRLRTRQQESPFYPGELADIQPDSFAATCRTVSSNFIGVMTASNESLKAAVGKRKALECKMAADMANLRQLRSRKKEEKNNEEVAKPASQPPPPVKEVQKTAIVEEPEMPLAPVAEEKEEFVAPAAPAKKNRVESESTSSEISEKSSKSSKSTAKKNKAVKRTHSGRSANTPNTSLDLFEEDENAVAGTSSAAQQKEIWFDFKAAAEEESVPVQPRKKLIIDATATATAGSSKVSKEVEKPPKITKEAPNEEEKKEENQAKKKTRSISALALPPGSPASASPFRKKSKASFYDSKNQSPKADATFVKPGKSSSVGAASDSTFVKETVRRSSRHSRNSRTSGSASSQEQPSKTNRTMSLEQKFAEIKLKKKSSSSVPDPAPQMNTTFDKPLPSNEKNANAISEEEEESIYEDVFEQSAIEVFEPSPVPEKKKDESRTEYAPDDTYIPVAKLATAASSSTSSRVLNETVVVSKPFGSGLAALPEEDMFESPPEKPLVTNTTYVKESKKKSGGSVTSNSSYKTAISSSSKAGHSKVPTFPSGPSGKKDEHNALNASGSSTSSGSSGSSFKSASSQMANYGSVLQKPGVKVGFKFNLNVKKGESQKKNAAEREEEAVRKKEEYLKAKQDLQKKKNEEWKQKAEKIKLQDNEKKAKEVLVTKPPKGPEKPPVAIKPPMVKPLPATMSRVMDGPPQFKPSGPMKQHNALFAKPMMPPADAYANMSKTPIKLVPVAQDVFKTPGNVSSSFLDVTSDGPLNSYDITVYEELDEDLKHRENKPIPDWAENKTEMAVQLFKQVYFRDHNPAFMNNPFPKVERGFKLFPGF